MIKNVAKIILFILSGTCLAGATTVYEPPITVTGDLSCADVEFSVSSYYIPEQCGSNPGGPDSSYSSCAEVSGCPPGIKWTYKSDPSTEYYQYYLAKGQPCTVCGCPRECGASIEALGRDKTILDADLREDELGHLFVEGPGRLALSHRNFLMILAPVDRNRRGYLDWAARSPQLS